MGAAQPQPRVAQPDILAALDAVILAAQGHDEVALPDAAVAGVVALAVSLGAMAYGSREHLVVALRDAAAAQQLRDLALTADAEQP